MLRPAWLVLHALQLAFAADAPPKSSTLAPIVPYAKLYSFLHSFDSLPKVLLLLPQPEEGKEEGKDAASPPSWFSSAALKFKEGRTKTASFAVVSEPFNRVGQRFGLEKIPAGGALVYCFVDGQGGGTFKLSDDNFYDGGGKSVRAAKEFVSALLSEGGEGLAALPSFPPPDRPRKLVPVKLDEMTAENQPSLCGPATPLCVLALIAEAECPPSLTDLARRHRNDPVQFVWVRAARQPDFLSAYGLAAAGLPALLAVRGGKRSRYALIEGPLELGSMGTFVDRILGGDMAFKRIPELPDLEPAYLQTDEEGDDEAADGAAAQEAEDATPAEDKMEL